MVNADLRIYDYATTSTTKSVFILGGSPIDEVNDRVAQFHSGHWLDSGELLHQRHNHGAISNSIETMIIGGYQTQIEIWKMSNDPAMHKNKTIGSIPSKDYHVAPVLFIVNHDYSRYCSRKNNFLAMTLGLSLGFSLGFYVILSYIRYKYRVEGCYSCNIRIRRN